MKLKRKSKLIPRFSLPAYHRKKVDGEVKSSPFSNKGKEWRFYTEEALYCTLQKPNKDSINIDLTGISSEDVFIIRTKTPMHEAEEGTGFIGSGVYIPDSFFLDEGVSSVLEIPSKGGWFNVISSKYWGNGIFPHYECVIKKDNNAKESDYPSDILTLCKDQWSTKTKLLSRVWVASWSQYYIIEDVNILHETLDDIADGETSWGGV
jgi:hypothetical protein